MASAFVGRTREISRLEALGAGTLVTLWGPGGVGKTRLAKEHAEHERRRGRVVVWADLAGARMRRDVGATLAAALGVALSAGDDATSDDEFDALGRAACARGALLVADNLEQLDADARAAIVRVAAAVRDASGTRAGSGATLLVTSRELLGAAHEVTIAVEPLGEDDGVALFEALAGVGGGAGSISTAAVAVTRSIVRRLDALPLAIELAAARAPLLGVTELLARLDRKLDVLGTAKADRPARHATLRAAIAWSWDLLDDRERDALMCCATFEAPFDASLAETVLASAAEATIGGAEVDALDLLERLRGRALIHAATDERGRTTLRLLESVRDFAREASVASGSDDDRWMRHAAAIVTRSEPLAEAATCGRDTLDELEGMRSDLASAVRRGGPSSRRAALALAALLAITGPPSAALEWVDEAMKSNAPVVEPRERRELSRPESEEVLILARLLLAKGDAFRALGWLDEARDCLSLPISFADDLGELPGARLLGADARRVRGSVLRALGDIDGALAHKAAALATYRALGDRAREGICLGEIGAVHQSEGRLALAKTCHAEAIAIHVATGSRRAEGVERSYLAVATHRAGDPAAAIALHDRAMTIHREVGHRRLEGAELLHLGFVHHELGAIVAAREAFASARTMLVAAGARGLEAITLVFAARLEVDAGDATAALLCLAEASRVAPASWPRVAATRHLVEGHLAMRTGAPARARKAYDAALATSRDLEVGFEALTPVYLALAIARSAPAEECAEVDVLIDGARTRIAALENPHLRVALEVLAASVRGAGPPAVPAVASAASSEVRRALALSGAQRALTVDDQGKRVVLPDGRAVDLSRRKNVRLVFLALARARRDTPGAVVLPDALLEAGWAGERMRSDAATKRLHTAIWTLRSLGFEALLLTEGEGYMLDPRINLVLTDG